MMFRI